MMLLCYTPFHYDDTILDLENHYTQQTMQRAMHQHTLDFASPAYSVHPLLTVCGGHEAFGVYLVFLIVKSMWVIYHTSHADVPLSTAKHSYH